ncbi:hypothetical protein cypCar_00045132 [Cyprinus carpio]|nr:hypothetical protein cypCar_00045132 [Cyprinus carpio]
MGSASGSGGACPRHFALFCSVVFVLSIFFSSVESYPNPLTDCEDYGDYIQGSALFSTLCGAHWRNQEQEQIQNVFKRVRSHSHIRSIRQTAEGFLTVSSALQFLFHYSKAHNSVGSVERESHSVHPLMRLSPKLSLRRKKQQV